MVKSVKMEGGDIVDKFTFRLLKFASRVTVFSLDDARKAVRSRYTVECVGFLVKQGALDYVEGSPLYRLSRIGQSLLAEERNRRFDACFTRTLAVIAIILSIMSIAAQLGLLPMK